MYNFKKAIILGLIVIFSSVLVGQPKLVQQIGIGSDNTKLTVSAFKAVGFKFPKQLEDQLAVKIAGQLFQLRADSHSSSADEFLMSTLFVFDKWQTEFQLLGLTDSDTVIAYFIASPSIPPLKAFAKTGVENCDPPTMIPQEIWRNGLPEPDYTRIPNEVSHQIIHHSSSQNNITDYTNLVRSIYLFHTEVNGWSDIGYNYLIAPDGSVFAGRDPGDFLDQDVVLGAHFCGSNTSTMGICMLGTFDTVAPTKQALQVLEQLLVWKSAKENLDPLGHLPHPLNQSLGTIAGHRDGCATMCPGDSLYAHLPLLRQQTLEQLHACNVFPYISENQIENNQIKLFPNPASEGGFTVKSDAEIQEIVLYSIDGRVLNRWKMNQKEIALETNGLNSGGVFLLHIRLVNELGYKRKLIIRPF